MIIREDKGDYYLIKADSGKLKIKGKDQVYSEATELKGKPLEYEEIAND